jgi:hypothetical protein
MLRTKYISPTFRNMRYNVWIINDVIKNKGELIWRSEKFSPFFPIDLGISPYYDDITINIDGSNYNGINGIKLKLDYRDNQNRYNPNIVLYGTNNQIVLLSQVTTPDRFEEFQNKVKQSFANKKYLMGQIRNSIPIENGRLVENGSIKESSYEGIVEKIRGVTYPLVKRS